MPIKRSLPCMLITICLTTAAHAQRGGGHPAPAARPAPSSHSSSVPASRPAPQAYATRTTAIAPAARPKSAYRPYPSQAVSAVRPAFYHGNHGGRPYNGRRGPFLYAGYGYPGYLNTNYLDYNGPYVDDATPADAAAPEDDNQPGPDQGPYLDQPTESEQFEPTAEPAPPPPAPEAITLVFKDGHTQQIYNFIATRSSIFVIQGQHHYDIAVADLDIPATQKANRAAGVDFALPAPRNNAAQ